MTDQYKKTATIIPFPNRPKSKTEEKSQKSCTPELGSLEWLEEKGLLFPHDLGVKYASIRKSRGPYRVPLPEDLI